MSTIVEASVPAAQFALADTLERIPGAEFRLVRHVAGGDSGAVPFLWARADDRDRLLDALERDDSTEDVDVLADFEEESLVAVDWRSRIRVLEHVVAEEDATVLDARGREEAWHLRLFFPDHDSVGAVYEWCKDDGIDVDLERICDLSDACQRGNLGLTEEQYEAISRAYEAGYYDVPRKINQEELASTFDVSHQALSERLRRGHQTVVANVLYRKLDGPEQTTPSRVGRVIDT